jgi:glycerol-3-phosphate O-acyltransferase
MIRVSMTKSSVYPAMPLQGGKLLWIAPSGGRDRPNVEGTWLPAPFDAASVDLMRNLIAMSKRPGHLFPLAMHTGEMMPPPATLDASIGERRLTSFVGVGACSSCSISCSLSVPS